MGVYFNSNLAATNTARIVRENYTHLSDTVRRLSSGLRINSAADDAAGLAIRELMRVDIAAYHQGIRNANDAISLIQTADGALSVIDEKLIRMKELAEQAATGTYNSTQRLIIDSEFQAMGAEIDRIARATDFNGLKLLDGSLSGTHDGSGLTSTGAMKIHFGAGNDSTEDYYYIDIGDCTCAGLGLTDGETGTGAGNTTGNTGGIGNTIQMPILNDFVAGTNLFMSQNITSMTTIIPSQGTWYTTVSGNMFAPNAEQNFMFIIPKGTKNIVINTYGTNAQNSGGDQDIQLFTTSGIHLAGTPQDDFVFGTHWSIDNSIDSNNLNLGFSSIDYDGKFLNTGPNQYDINGNNLKYIRYNNMTIGYSGDPDRYDINKNDGSLQGFNDYEILTIDEATEDLIFWLPGENAAYLKVFWNLPDAAASGGTTPGTPGTPAATTGGNLISIKTQELAQNALERIDDAIVTKDNVRAHLGAMQNRLENTVSNLSIQAENLQASESRISDVDVAEEMTKYICNQILTKSAIAMLAQANSLPQMLVSLIEG